jgi:hypothetical protein
MSHCEARAETRLLFLGTSRPGRRPFGRKRGSRRREELRRSRIRCNACRTASGSRSSISRMTVKEKGWRGRRSSTQHSDSVRARDAEPRYVAMPSSNTASINAFMPVGTPLRGSPPPSVRVPTSCPTMPAVSPSARSQPTTPMSNRFVGTSHPVSPTHQRPPLPGVSLLHESFARVKKTS